MNKINYRTVLNVLNEQEMKKVRGGCLHQCFPSDCDNSLSCITGGSHGTCRYNNYSGMCDCERIENDECSTPPKPWYC